MLVADRVHGYASADNKRVCVMTKTHPYQKHTSSADYFQNLDISQMVENEADQIKCLNYLKILTPGRGCEEITQFCRHYGKLVRYINYV